jgi:pectate lyase
VKNLFLTKAAAAFALAGIALAGCTKDNIPVNPVDNYDQNKPFGFCTVSSRTSSSSTYTITGGGSYTYPVPDGAPGVVVLTSTRQDMKKTIEDAIKNSENRIIIFDGSNGDFIVSSSVKVSVSNKTLLGINGARICTEWVLSDEIKQALDEAGVPTMSNVDGGGELINGIYVKEEAEYNTRRIIIEMTGDLNEHYRKAGILTLNGCENIIIRNLKFVGPGAFDAAGNDLITSSDTKNCWVDHCEFTDGLDGNFDINKSSDFHTVSWCVFNYTDRSYMNCYSNLIGGDDSNPDGFLNTTFAFNWWGKGCHERMPMGRIGKIHVLNNYYSCIGASNGINPRLKSEFLVEGNYFDKGVSNYFSQSDATAVTWMPDNYVADAKGQPASFGPAVSVPYAYPVAAAAEVPIVVQLHAGATLFRR